MPETQFPKGIEVIPNFTEWENCHQNFKHSFKKDASYKLRMPDNTASDEDNYRGVTANMQWLIQHAIDNGQQLRAMGSGWSFSEVAISEGGIIDTKSLNLAFNIGKNFVSDDYSGDYQNLFLVECGTSIDELNEMLEERGDFKRCLRASGASNGQSIAGATSTGTHGSAFNVGAVHDSIVGLHIVVGPNRHVWLERKSYPVASDQFIAWLGAEAIRDDDTFNAAVVSFGSFGIIHGILLETEPIFLLEEKRSGQIAYTQQLKDAIDTLSLSDLFNTLGLPPDDAEKQLYHFEVIVNPHHFKPDDAEWGVYMKTIYKKAYGPYTKRPADTDGFTYGNHTLGVIEFLMDDTGFTLNVVPKLVNKLFPLAFKPGDPITGTIGEIFTNTKFRGKVASAAIGIDIKHASDVIEIALDVNKNSPFAGAIALRFVKGTKALLGFTHFPKTCILELDGVDAEGSRDFFKKVWLKLEESDIPYTLHWGKINFLLTPERVRKMYGDENVNKWLACRSALLDPECRKVFNNKFLEQCGLSESALIPEPPIV